MLSPASLHDALTCIHCNSELHSPVSLHCGHCVCAAHIHTPPRCPVLSCRPLRPARSSLPRIPPQSRVRLFASPAPQEDDEEEEEDLPPLQSVHPTARDVTVANVLSLVARTKQRLAADTPPRPRKRRRQQCPSPELDLLTHLTNQSTIQRSTRPDSPVLPTASSSSSSILAEFDKDLCAELSCDICANLLFQPVTTPCQHTFCAKCLQRSLDHSPACPLCRETLPGFFYFQDHPINATILKLLLRAYPLVYSARAESIQQEERDARLDTPIFVCELCFPGLPTIMHIFEPRYRLMLRRCLESPQPQFGMIMPPKAGSPSALTHYGTMLEIRAVRMLPDGRSMVETWGSYRFRILERGTLDGYDVGRIERIDDYDDDLIDSIDHREDNTTVQPIFASPSPGPSSSSTSSSAASPAHRTTPSPTPSPAPASAPTRPARPSNAELMDVCRQFLDRIQRGTAPWVVQRLSNSVGVMPSDPALFSFWVAKLLPIDDSEKAKLLPIRSARLRLLLVAHWIEQLDDNWWFSNGCTILTVFVFGSLLLPLFFLFAV